MIYLVIGVAMLAVVFIGVLALVAKEYGWRTTLGCLLVAVLGSAWFICSALLIAKGIFG